VMARGGFEHLLQAPLQVGGQFVGTLNMARRSRHPPFNRHDLLMMRTVSRFASAAVGRALEFEWSGRMVSATEQALRLLEIPLIVTRSDGQVVFVNDLANELLSNPSIAALLEDIIREHTRLLLAGKGTVAVTPSRCPVGGPPDLPERNLPRAWRGLTVKSILVSAGTGDVISLVYGGVAMRELASHTLPTLSARERQVAELVALGFNNPRIASSLTISRDTVKEHLKHIFEKLRVSSRAELAATVASVSRR
ncbi:MAG: helix-turn-helix transcriptional regulator, partial [Chloroflexota bacterium]